MSEEQLKAFLERVKADNSLQEKLKAATDWDSVVAIANDAGFMISAIELKKAQSELSEKELEVVAGGGAIADGICDGILVSFIDPEARQGFIDGAKKVFG